MKSESALAQTVLTLAARPEASAIIYQAAQAIQHGHEPERVAALVLETYETHLAAVTKMAEHAMATAPLPPIALPPTYDLNREQLLAFAEEVRRQTGRMIALTQINPQRAQEMAAELCTKAANMIQQKQMQEEQSAVDDLDLSQMPAPTFTDEAE